ncbi:hypothetical protein PRZ48_007604 [Zasmidium cellare]|uniref:Uncharacterized protein n=1 Tax=Zasmidium cellare TaxID=395010 RepID=A0ABR0EKV6_ZASCE|nr:hypothetical protein PRZ48_007604 [Zasmidium cellare]
MSPSSTEAPQQDHQHQTIVVSSASDMDEHADDTQQRCYFFKPPPEIREHIYQYAVTLDPRKELIEDGHVKHDGECFDFCCLTSTNWRTRRALLQVCRAITHEATPIVYRAIRFHFYIDKDNYNLFLDWLDIIGKERSRLISSLVISWQPTEASRKEFLETEAARLQARIDEAQEQLAALRDGGQSQGPAAVRPAVPSTAARTRLVSKLVDMVSHEVTAHQEAIGVLARSLSAAEIALDAIALDEVPSAPNSIYLREVQHKFVSSLKSRLISVNGSGKDKEA